MTAKSIKYFLGFFLAAALIAVPTVSSQDTGYETLENQEVLQQSEWRDKPMYVQNLSTEVMYDDTIEVRKTGQRCTDWKNESLRLECNQTEEYVYGGKNKYLFDIQNIDTAYLGNGEVRLSFEIARNDLTKLIHTRTKDQRFKPGGNIDNFIQDFNDRYLYNGERISSDAEAQELLQYTNNVEVSSLGGTVKGKKLQSDNLMAVSNSRIVTVVQLDDFRSGGVKLNDAVGVRLETMNYNGGGARP